MRAARRSFLAGVLAAGAAAMAQGGGSAPVHPSLAERLAAFPDRPAKAWVFFEDKGLAGDELQDAIDRVRAGYDGRAVRRRLLRRTDPGLFDERDVPVAGDYLRVVEETGARVHIESSWLNAASVWATREQAERIAALPFVRSLEPVRGGRRVEPAGAEGLAGGARGAFYGRSESQLQQIGVPALHAAGHTGQGVVIGVLDTGFHRTHAAFNHPAHPLAVVAEHDFVNNDGDTGIEAGDHPDQHRHGTWILGTLAAYLPGELVGGAYDASYVLCKTEDLTSETPIEEDNYVAGLQFIESHGGDVATSSLGYIDWYTQGQLDGLTAVTTVAVNIATANGVHCCTAAGNMGHDGNPASSHLIAPADALRVITCGAADSGGAVADFSSDGPTADGRTKPELLARGVATDTVSSSDDNEFAQLNGTSLSTPLVAGAVACLAGARPSWTPDQMRTMLFATAADFVQNGAPDPLMVRGYGMAAAAAALALDCNANGVPDPQDIASASSGDVNGNGVPDECECIADIDGDGVLALADFVAFRNLYVAGGLAADFDGSGDLTLGDFVAFRNVYAAGCP